MVLCHAFAVALFVGFFGCLATDGGDADVDIWAKCLREHNNSAAICCPGGWHISYGTCCPDGSHKAIDINHPLWVICTLDEDPGTDAGADAHTYADASLTDAP